MIQIILLVQGCRDGTGTVQNKKMYLFLLDRGSVAKVCQQPLLAHWVIQNYCLLKALFYMKLCHIGIILNFAAICFISVVQFLLTFCFPAFPCQPLQLQPAACCRHTLKKLSNDLGKGQYGSAMAKNSSIRVFYA